MNWEMEMDTNSFSLRSKGNSPLRHKGTQSFFSLSSKGFLTQNNQSRAIRTSCFFLRDLREKNICEICVKK